MDTYNLLKKIPFTIPEEIVKDIQSEVELSDKLNIIRNWVQCNLEINHKKRLDWHQPILEIARTGKVALKRASGVNTEMLKTKK